MVEWKTKISDSKESGAVIRGKKLEELVGKISFTEMIYLVLKGKLPSQSEKNVLDAIFVSAAEHGIAVPSATTARIAASGSGNLVQSVAAGILALGKYHGGAIEGCAKVLQESAGKPELNEVRRGPANSSSLGRTADEIVADAKARGERLAGFGHKIYTEDPRTKKLFEIAKSENIFGRHCEFALQLEAALEKSSGRKLCLNIDGAIAALISDLGFDWRLANAFFIIPRTVGISAHVFEELTEEKPYSKRLDDGEWEYLGDKN